METRDRVRIQHMLEAAKEALAFAHEKERDDIESNRILARALVECLRVVGVAARQVSIETRQQHPRVPWQDIIGMRNRLVHEYFDVNYDVIWQTVTAELPNLVEVLEQQKFDNTTAPSMRLDRPGHGAVS